jgi:hypothetical protein
VIQEQFAIKLSIIQNSPHNSSLGSLKSDVLRFFKVINPSCEAQKCLKMRGISMQLYAAAGRGGGDVSKSIQ